MSFPLFFFFGSLLLFALVGCLYILGGYAYLIYLIIKGIVELIKRIRNR